MNLFIDTLVSVGSHTIAYGMIIFGIFTFISLFMLQAPYGRFSPANRDKNSSWTVWGPLIPARLAWLIMETPSIYTSLYIFITYSDKAHYDSIGNRLYLGLFLLHYIVRGLVYPMLMGTASPMPLSIMLMSFSFTCTNGALQGLSLGRDGPVYNINDVLSPISLVGIALFLFGFFANQQADHILRNLRKPGETGYKIPYGGLYRFVSVANYTGELIEWAGFALCVRSIAGLAFLIATFGNLVPRAISYHSWYQQKFDNYPKNRKAVIPFIL